MYLVLVFFKLYFFCIICIGKQSQLYENNLNAFDKTLF